MAPKLATLITLIFIIYLFYLDFKNKPNGVSKGIWIPIIWMFFAGTRYLGQWVYLRSTIPTMNIYMEGSPLDRNTFLLLIVIGLIILAKRKVKFGLVFKGMVYE